MAVAIAAAYVRYERLPWIQDVFYGVGAAVIAIIGMSAYRLSRKTISKDVFLWCLFAMSHIVFPYLDHLFSAFRTYTT